MISTSSTTVNDDRSSATQTELRATAVAAGFVDFQIINRVDVYADAPQSSSAAQFGTLGINVRAVKARSAEEWERALATLTCATGETAE